MKKEHPLKVFLNYASEDKAMVSKLYDRLKRETDMKPWMDDKDLLGGRWEPQILTAMRDADSIAICVSETSAKKEGYLNKEIRIALDIAKKKQDSAAFIVLVRLEECPLPFIEGLSEWQWVDYFVPDGYEKLLKFFRSRAEQLKL